jgi:predicted transposase/invertase (TIGR01784 family)
VREFVPDFNYNLQDISHLPDEEIKGAVLLKILLKTLKYIYTPELKHKLPDIFRLFREVENKTKGTEYLEVLLRYLGQGTDNLSKDELQDSVTKVFELEGGNVMATIAEQWIQEGEKRGEKRGERKGIINTAKNLLKMGIDIDKIAKATGLKKDEIKELSTISH